MEKVVMRINATVQDHGFKGILAFCEGHSKLSCETPKTIVTNDHDSVNTPMTGSVAVSNSGKSTSSVSSISGGVSDVSGAKLKHLDDLIRSGASKDEIQATWTTLFSPANVAAAAPVNPQNVSE